MRVFLTGASGFVGRQIERALVARGHEVVGFTRAVGDFLSPVERGSALAAARAEIVVHAAWYVEHGAFWQAEVNRRWREESIRFIDEARRAGVTRFIGLGTCYEYAWPPEGLCDERRTPSATHTPYDEAKSATHAALAARESGGFSTAWARLFFLYGEGEGVSRLAPSVAQRLLRGERFHCSSGPLLRDFLDVREAGAAIAALALSQVCGPVNIASGDPLSVGSFACTIGEELGCPELVLLGALPEHPSAPAAILAAVERLRNEVGYRQTSSLRDGIRAFCEMQRSAIPAETM
jgi:nucleoside-diphosphate-sugar epimerase